jgi:DNA-binding CsgD family transcriptional regulator
MRSSGETVTQHITVVIAGRSNQEIGRALYAAAGTVKHHVKAILGKLDAIRCDGADAGHSHHF